MQMTSHPLNSSSPNNRKSFPSESSSGQQGLQSPVIWPEEFIPAQDPIWVSEQSSLRRGLKVRPLPTYPLKEAMPGRSLPLQMRHNNASGQSPIWPLADRGGRSESPDPAMCWCRVFKRLFKELHQWCPAILSSDTLFFCPQSFPISGTSPMSHLFTSDDQNTGVSASASVLPVNIQGWSPLRLTGLIFLLSKGLSGVFSSITIWRHRFFVILPSLQSSSHNCMWPLGRP